MTRQIEPFYSKMFLTTYFTLLEDLFELYPFVYFRRVISDKVHRLLVTLSFFGRIDSRNFLVSYQS